jgi:hypothetical protein
MTEPDLTEFSALTENDELRGQISDLQARLRRAQTKTEDLVDAVRQGSKDAAIVLGNPPPVPKAPSDRRKKHAETALLHLSDWQVGKVTESFNSEVAGRRVDVLAEKVVRLTEIERADHPVPECHVMWGGDMAEGVTVFPGQAFEVDGSLFAQMFSCIGAGERLLRQLLASFDRVVCWQEPGNHGRIGRKGDVPKADNADLLIYDRIRDRLSSLEAEGRLVWNPPQGWHSIVEIGNYRALLVHGDEVKSFGGQTPAFGITKKVNAWATGVVAPFDDCYMGHWHQPLVLPIAHGKGRTFVNPSLESDNVYAQEFVGANGSPGQRLNFIDPETGRVSTERIIWLDHVH